MIKDNIPLSGRILAIDYGRKRVGLAVTDALQITAQPYQTISGFKNVDQLIQKLQNFCDEQNIVGVVIGLPRNMDGSLGEMAKEVDTFSQSLHSTLRIPVILWDERMTSLQASRVLQETGKKVSKSKDIIDQIAASFILRNYLDSRLN